MGLAIMLSAGLAPGASAKTKLTWFVTGTSWKTLAEKFTKENPGVTINLISGEMDKFYTMTTAGLMPDIWGPWGTPGIHADVNRNWAVELTPFLKRDEKGMNANDFFPGLMREFRVNGKQYSLPIFNYVDYYYYNTDLYAQAGVQPPPKDANDRNWNWERMVVDMKKIAKVDGNGKVTVAGLDFARDAHSPAYWHLWNASPYSKKAVASSVPQEMHYNTPEMVTALQAMWDLIYKYKIAGPGNFGIANGKVAATIEPGWANISVLMKTKKVHWKLATMPWAKTNAGSMWPDGWRISRVCKDKEMAWRFVKFLCSPDSMRFIVNNQKDTFTGTPVARKSVFNETLGKNIGAVTGMTQDEVFAVHAQCDEVDIVKYQETICLDQDMKKFVDPILTNLWANRVSPVQAANQLQSMVDKRLPEMFKRWVRNIKFTGAE